MGSGSLPGQDLPTRLVAVEAEGHRGGRDRPAPAAARAAGLRAGASRSRCWPIPARSWTATRKSWWPRSGRPSSRGSTPHVERHPRHRRPHRPRQDGAGQGTDRLRDRPAEGGERAGDVDRPGLRPLPRRRPGGGDRGRARPRELHQDHGRRGLRHGRRDPGGRRRRRHHAPNPRASRHPHAAGRPPRPGGADEDRPGRSRAAAAGRGRPGPLPPRHVPRSRAGAAGVERDRRGIRRRC